MWICNCANSRCILPHWKIHALHWEKIIADQDSHMRQQIWAWHLCSLIQDYHMPLKERKIECALSGMKFFKLELYLEISLNSLVSSKRRECTILASLVQTEHSVNKNLQSMTAYSCCDAFIKSPTIDHARSNDTNARSQTHYESCQHHAKFFHEWVYPSAEDHRRLVFIPAQSHSICLRYNADQWTKQHCFRSWGYLARARPLTVRRKAHVENEIGKVVAHHQAWVMHKVATEAP